VFQFQDELENENAAWLLEYTRSVQELPSLASPDLDDIMANTPLTALPTFPAALRADGDATVRQSSLTLDALQDFVVPGSTRGLAIWCSF
jgi:hypothetical protein